MAVNYEEQILELVRTLSDDQKQQALEYLRVLKRPKGTSGTAFLAIAKDVRITDEDAAEMLAAIDEACEVIEDEEEVSFDD